MSLDRDAARALFANASLTPAAAGGTPFASASPFSSGGNEALSARMSGVSARNGPDWRLIAPVGVAVLCAGVVLLITAQGDHARPGKPVAATPVTRPLAMSALVSPVESKPVTPPSAIIEPAAPAASPTIRDQPARRPAPVRKAEIAPADTSVHEPYVPPTVFVTPAPLIIAPAPPPPVIAPEPEPTAPQPQL